MPSATLAQRRASAPPNEGRAPRRRAQPEAAIAPLAPIRPPDFASPHLRERMAGGNSSARPACRTDRHDPVFAGRRSGDQPRSRPHAPTTISGRPPLWLCALRPQNPAPDGPHHAVSRDADQRAAGAWAPGASCNQPETIDLPFLITVTPRSFTLASKEIVSPSFHIRVTMVSPGKTGEEKRTSWLRMRAGS
jgi:hypothetical protein